MRGEGGVREGDHPAPVRDKSMMRARLSLDKALRVDAVKWMAFVGTDSLNSMQSAVFDATYNTLQNLLICAPTGAGKTNVAMLAVVSHLRDLGLVGATFHDRDHHNEGGEISRKKIVYITTMKALAQNVVEKFSAKFKSLGIKMKELTGTSSSAARRPMQFTAWSPPKRSRTSWRLRRRTDPLERRAGCSSSTRCTCWRTSAAPSSRASGRASTAGSKTASGRFVRCRRGLFVYWFERQDAAEKHSCPTLIYVGGKKIGHHWFDPRP